MNIYDINTQNINLVPKPKNLVLGFFDGIHVGHLSLFQEPNTSLLTFLKIPRKTTNLFSLEDRIQIFQHLGLKNLYFFDILKTNLTAKEFIEKILTPLQPNKIIVGENFSFGSDGQSAFYLQMHFPNVEIVKIKKHLSTSDIRYWLTATKPNFIKINRLLITPYFRTGIVVHGYHDGQKLGIPTANLIIQNDLIDLMDGVYITLTKLHHKTYHSLTFWGKPKTLNHSKAFIETWLLDYQGKAFYNQKIEVIFLKYLRKSKKFKSKLELLKAIKKDQQKAKKFFKKYHL